MLKFIGEPDGQESTVETREKTIVVAAAASEAPTGEVPRDEWDQHDGQSDGGQKERGAARLGNAKPARLQCLAGEPSTETEVLVLDGREVHRLTQLKGLGEARLGGDLTIDGRISENGPGTRELDEVAELPHEGMPQCLNLLVRQRSSVIAHLPP